MQAAAADFPRTEAPPGREGVSGWGGTGGDVRRVPFTWNNLLWSMVCPQRGHRLLPTVSGTLLIAVAFGIGAAAYNSSNNILFITLSLLIACLVLSGLLSWLNFRRVTWRLRVAGPLRAGHAAMASAELRNGRRFLPAYGLWLENNIKQATLILAEGLDGSFNKFIEDKADALAGLRPRLIEDVKKLPGARILDGQFASVQQAVGTPKKNLAAAAFLKDFVEEAKRSGFVKSLIEKHGTVGRLSVAPPA